MTIEEIEGLIRKNKTGEAMEALDRFVAEHPQNAQARFMRGKLWWRLGRRRLCHE